MKKCSSCGFEQSPDSSRFCIRCGAPLSDGQAENTGFAQQNARPAAPVQGANPSLAAPSAPSTSRPSPYAALPHIPKSAKGGRAPQRGKTNELFKGMGFVLAFILCTVGLFWYCLSSSGLEGSHPGLRPQASFPGGSTGPAPAAPSKPSSFPSPSQKPSWDFEIVEIDMEESADGYGIYVFGELELHSSSTIMNGRVTVELYDKNDRLLQNCTADVLVLGSEIKFRIRCALSPSQMHLVDYYNVILQLSDGL